MRISTSIQTNPLDKGNDAGFVANTNLPSEEQFSQRETPSQSKIPRVRLVPLNANWYKKGQAPSLYAGAAMEASSSPTASARTFLKKTLKNPWFKFGSRLGCTILLFFILFHSIAKSISFPSLVSKLGTMDCGMLLIGIIVGLFCVIISAYQWQCLLDGERIHMDLRKLTNLYLIGIAFNHFLPTGMGGDIVKAYYVGKEGNNVPGSASAVIMSRVTGFFGMLFVSVPAILIWHTIFAPSVIALFLLACLAMCIALGSASLLVTFLPKLGRKWTKRRPIGKEVAPFPLPFLAPLLKVGKAIRTSCTRPRFIFQATLFGIIFHLSAALNYYCYAKMLNIPVPINFYMVAIPFISLIAFLPISLNGYGLRESALIALFATTHASASIVLLTALLVDVQALLFGAIGGLIYITMGQRHPKEQNAQTPVRIRTKKLPI